ncbi:MAG: MFS transporter [Gammaproteobacteria bacterium]
MEQNITSPMTSMEKRATLSLAGIYALRMLGLFMILPVLSLFAEQLIGSTPLLIGLSISVYGLSQALLQIPFGLLSDRFGRKRIIIFGLLLFIAGSVVAAISTTIYGVLFGRALQGAGAIAAAIMALVADLTQEVHRTKAMATIGLSIGASFGLAVTLGPVIAGFMGVQGIFWLTAALAVVAIFVLVYAVPDPVKSKVHRDAELVPGQMRHVLKNLDLLRLNYGIFVLHLILTASFVVIPLLMRDVGIEAKQHWLVYLPVFVVSMIIAVPFVILAEKKRKMKVVFIGAIAVVIVSEIGLMRFHGELLGIVGFLGLFFCGFNLLEATLPSLISKTAPGDMKGTAMGFYSSSQFLGAFIGGAAGGWSYGEFGGGAVFIVCAAAGFSWLVLSLTMSPPRHLANMLISIERLTKQEADKLADAMLEIAGIEEVKLHLSEGVVYLKVDNQQLDKAQLQYLITQSIPS